LTGVLNLVRLKGKPEFGERETWLLSFLAAIFSQFIHNARVHYEVFTENQRLKEEVRGKYAFEGIIGQSAELKSIFALLERVIPTDARVIIEGESGTGKELIAKVIHYNGLRKNAPFVAVDCGALPANLLEGELFGYVKGAFTGAIRDKKGLFEVAHNGTLFLDEIANMPLEIQSKLLRAIQEGEIRPLGSTVVKKVDVRIIAAGSGELKEKVAEGTFREDLFYRLNVVSVKLPPLRQRKGDIPLLADFFLKKMAGRHQREIKGFKAETMARLEAYSWPGNVRELENIVERMVILTEDHQEYIPVELLPMEIYPQNFEKITAPPPETASENIKNKKAFYEKMMLIEALTKSNWNQSAAARELGISERTVRYKMQKFGIEKP
jgi:transcriptional regulator with PAS, ATPase and Fis domain